MDTGPGPGWPPARARAPPQWQPGSLLLPAGNNGGVAVGGHPLKRASSTAKAEGFVFLSSGLRAKFLPGPPRRRAHVPLLS